MITISVNGVEYPMLERKFIITPQELMTDVVTLSNDMYTDYSGNTYNEWTINYQTLTDAQYQAIRADYDAQKTTGEYPVIDIPFYGVEDQPARMFLNERDVWNNCGSIEGLEIVFRETAQQSTSS